MNLMIIAGEASGDQYGARVIRAAREKHPDLSCFGIGGEAMRAEGMELLFHTSQTSIMGFVEVLRHAGFLRKMFRDCEDELVRRRPDALLLIDYPGFNLRFAGLARRHGIPVLYYIAPQVWAWGKGRVRKLRERVNALAVVFPFEVKFFEKAGLKAEFVGHPLLEILETVSRDRFLEKHQIEDRPILGLFPGSRVQEIRRILPVMLETAAVLRKTHNIQPVIGAARLPDEVFTPWLHLCPSARMIRNDAHALMEHSHCAMVTSGTATVETAFYRTPFAILYKAGRINYEIGKRLVNVPYIGMANILANQEAAPEFIQHECRSENILPFLEKILTDPEAHALSVKALSVVRSRMGEPGASRRVAELLIRIVGSGS